MRIVHRHKRCTVLLVGSHILQALAAAHLNDKLRCHVRNIGINAYGNRSVGTGVEQQTVISPGLGRCGR